MPEVARALDPYKIHLGDKDYEFFQSWWVIRKLSIDRRKIQEGGDSSELALDLLPKVLFDSCTNKGEMTLEQFEQLIPGDAAWVQEHILALQKHSAAQNRPREVVEEKVQAPTIGSESGPPPESPSG